MTDYTRRTIAEAQSLLREKKISVRELAAEYEHHIKEKNAHINAYIEVFSDIDAQAAAAQQLIDAGVGSALTGIPLSVKDNILIEGRQATSSSKILEGYTAPYDAAVIARLKKEQPVFLGRTNMDEFAMGGSTETSYYGLTRNPLDPTRVPGGSSGGAAASVAMDGALAALGSDTGGSIRQPAAFCGLVGLKPTYGTVSRHGLMAMASSLDQIGPITRTVEDAEIVYNSIRGRDQFDSTSVEGVSTKTTVKVVGVPREFLEGLEGDILKEFEASLSRLKDLGYEVRDISLPILKYGLSVYYILMPAEASSNLARYDGVKYGLHAEGTSLSEDYGLTRGEGFGKEVRRRIILGTYVLSTGYYDAYYNKANTVRSLIKKHLDEAFTTVDLIATPTTPTPAFKIGEKTSDPVAMYLADIFTVSANLAGIPALSVPGGTVERDGVTLPVGMQLMGPHFSEPLLFEAGKKFLGEV